MLCAMTLISAFFAWFIALLVTYYCIPLFSSIAYKFGILDQPHGIKKHKQPTPYLGGLAVYLGFIVALGLVVPFYTTIGLFLIGVTILLFVGLIDDLLVLQPSQKFLGQFLGALCFFKAGLCVKECFFINHTWTIPLSFLWILTVVNAYNLVDVMDGLATTLALCATGSFALIAFGLGHTELVYILSAFLGALMAFLRYNWPLAGMYLGDAGSLCIGGVLATVPFLIEWTRFNTHGYVAPVIILALPLLEVAFLIIIRTWKKIPFFQGSPHHFSIYLRQKGWSVEKILLLCCALSILLLSAALLVTFTKIPLIYVIVSGIAFVALWCFLIFSSI